MRSLYVSGNRDASAPATGNSRMAITHLAFLLLFPGFFFYQTLIGLGKINSFLGGYFSGVTVILLFPLLFYYGRKIKTDARLFSKVDLYFSIFVTYFSLIVAVNFLSGANILIVQNHLRSIAYYATLFITFKFTDFDNPRFKLLLIGSIITMSAIIFTFSVDGTFYLATLNLAKDSESVANYQAFSRSYLITLIAVISFVKSFGLRATIYCVAAPTLYLNGARSEFVAMFFMLPIVEIYRSRHRLHTLILLGLLCAIVAFNFDHMIGLLPTNRMLELLDLSQSSSANARNYLNAQAVNTILANPMLGDYASYVPGDYAHNILSAWVDLGVFGFVYLLALLIIPELLLMSEGFLRNTTSSDLLLAFCLLSVTIFLLFTSHYFTDMAAGAALGAYANYRHGRKE